RSEFFDTERSEVRSEDHCILHVLEGKVSCLGQVSCKSSRKGISGPGGVEHFLQRQGGCKKHLSVVEQQGSVFSFFNDHIFGSHLLDLPGCLDQGMLLRELARLFIVDGNDIYL